LGQATADMCHKRSLAIFSLRFSGCEHSSLSLKGLKHDIAEGLFGQYKSPTHDTEPLQVLIFRRSNDFIL
jgi:hypothetical protein